MTILEQAEELRQKAIALLVQERETINQHLQQLGYAEAEPRNSRKSVTCGKCHAEGHTARTCKGIPSEQI